MHELFDQRRYLIPFRSLLLPHIFTDTLVIGGGVAGMRAALAAATHGDVIMLLKDTEGLCSTSLAQGGVAVVRSEGDTFDSHAQDTLDAGAGLCDALAVQTLVREGPAAIDELIRWGVRFDRDSKGELRFGREGGHHHARILHTDGDATGREFMRCLLTRAQQQDNIRVFRQCFALDLLTIAPPSDASGRRDLDNPPRVLGAVTHHPRYGLQIIWAKATILATGGAGQVYRETTNPRTSTGDGMALAYRAGASVCDCEFMQFHPTTLYVAGAGRALISEAVRGEGALLLTRDGRRFMPDHHDMAELAPRDVVSRSIMQELARSAESCVYLDARPIGRERFTQRFPGLTELLHSFDLDPGRDLIPVHPSAHYTIAGVRTDLDGRTDLPGLYACGEAASNGLHGANRLASNSLLEGLVYGKRAGLAAAETSSLPSGPVKIISDIHLGEHGELDLLDVLSSLRSVMWRNVGIERSGPRLDDVVDMFDFWARYTLQHIFDEPVGWETQNLLFVGALMTRAASWREETRGVHWRRDFPDAREVFLCRASWRAGDARPVVSNLEPAPQPAA